MKNEMMNSGKGKRKITLDESFKLWTGKEMPVEHIKDILNLKF